MKIAILGGAGAMGGIFGALLAKGGYDVTLVDVAQAAVDKINAEGIYVELKSGAAEHVRVPATTTPATLGAVDTVINFVKCYHTDAAIRSVLPVINDKTAVLSLQNGWGNAPRIAAIVGEDKVLAGVTYHSGTLVGPGHVKQTGVGMTFMGELNGVMSDRLNAIATAFQQSGIEVTASDNVLFQIWSKLALNCCTLPASALLRFYAHQMVEHDGTLNTMHEILREVIAVANAQNIPLNFDERWEAITGLLKRAVGGKASMLQDVENRRRTEIDVVNGAIVEAGQRLGIPTPYNQTMVWMTKALEETF
jgi:2-dehydropantoate 2-reductase